MRAVKDDQSVVVDQEPNQDKSHEPSGPRSAARSAAGRRAKKTDGSAPAATNGTLSIQEKCVKPASISGLRPSASLAGDGRRIRSGMRDEAKFRTAPTSSAM